MNTYQDEFKELIDWKVYNYLLDKLTKYQDIGSFHAYVFIYIADTSYSNEYSLNNDHLLLKSDKNSDVIWFNCSEMEEHRALQAYKNYNRICYGVYLPKMEYMSEYKETIKINGYELVSKNKYIAVYEKSVKK